MIKGNNYIKITVFIIIYFLVILINNSILTNISQIYHAIINRILILVSMFIFGLTLGLEYTFNQKVKEGEWLCNKKRILILGLPLFLVIAYFYGIEIAAYLTDATLRIPSGFPLKLMLFGQNPYPFYLLPFLLGYVITTSFYKEDI